MKRLVTGILGVLLVIAFASQASAANYSLETAGSSASIDGTIGGVALFTQASTLSGTGVFPSFVQLQATGQATVESGYNTTVNNVGSNGASDQFNHEIQVSNLSTVTVGGTAYYQFFLDINEANNATDRYLSLDDLVVRISGTPNQSTVPLPAVGTTVWSLPTDTHILLDYSLEAGSGKADMTFLVPVADFTAAGATTSSFVYLFSEFGELGVLASGGVGANGVAFAAGNYGASAGFEEWATGLATPGVPDGGMTLGLLGLGMLGLGMLRRRLQ